MANLRVFHGSPFDLTTLVDMIDVFTSDGITTAYTLLNKTGLRLGESIQAGPDFYSRAAGQYTLLGDTFTLSTAPVLGTPIIAPGLARIQIRAYDQNVVEGVITPRNKEKEFYIAPEDPLFIVQFKYFESPGNSGIRLSFSDKDATNGAQLSWLSVAPALADGTPGTYQPLTTPLDFDPIEATDIVQTTIPGGSSTVDVVDGSQFTAGRYLILDPGTVTEEQVKLLSILGNTLTITPTAYAHTAFVSTVFEYGVKFWLKTDIPVNASGGTPVNLNDIVPRILGSAESRI